MRPSKAALVFCEGAHDIAFVRRSLGVVAKCELLDKASIQDLPTPLGAGQTRSRGVIESHYNQRRFADLKLPAANRAPTPIFDSVLSRGSDTQYYLLRMEGASKSAAVLPFLTSIDDALQFRRATFDIQQFAHVFLFDADSIGVSRREQEFLTQYGEFFGLGAPLTHATWQPTNKGPVGLWIHHDPATPNRSGTLEDVLAPMFAAAIPERWQGANAYIADHARHDDPVHRKRIKAQITIAGQIARPGDPMSEMLRRGGSKDRGEVLPPEVFRTGPARDLAQFLIDVPWA